MVTLTDDKSDTTYSDKPLPPLDAPSGLPPDYSEATQSQSDPSVSPLPAFSESSGSSTIISDTLPPFSVFEPLTRPTNYLTIERQNSGIKGTYSIDPSLPVPPGAVVSKDPDGNNLNLRLYSTNGSVQAVLDIVRGSDAKGPARLDVGSKNGSTEVTVHDRRQNRFRLRAISQNGSVTINIPTTFTGSVYSKLQNGRLRFHSEVEQRLTTFSELKNEARHFIGDFSAHGYEDEETWQMDHLHLESQNGNVTVNFISNPNFDDSSASKGKGKGFFSRFL
ncbi:hypothetical protein Clacol_004497 [Clathrus columnatus]|uniref:DUF7330 domain-containing protein n=1 Tax=Clathrus columnatus TaxID=1419009 RepID=A0AAV5AB69_9AGAM|nr:hypothetical protein Clacol_004497 [Clathrus columnatus]